MVESSPSIDLHPLGLSVDGAARTRLARLWIEFLNELETHASAIGSQLDAK